MESTIDGLPVYLVSVNSISETNHGFQGQELHGYEKLKKIIHKRGIDIPIVLYHHNNELRICDGWHRWKIYKELQISEIPAVIFNSIEECHPKESIKW